MIASVLRRHPLPSLLASQYLLIEPLSFRPGRQVFRAMHRPTRQARVLKIISGVADDAAVRQRLFQLGDIEHHNVAPIASVGQPDRHDTPRNAPATFWATTAYVPGLDLEELARRVGRLPLGPVLCCARETLQALRPFHERGLAHGSVRADHLIAGSGHDAVVLLSTGGLASWKPRTAELAARADDLLQLGQTLVLLLTGEPLGDEGISRPGLAAVLARLERQRPELPRPFLRWLGRLLEPDRADRFVSATPALDALVHLGLRTTPAGALSRQRPG